MPDATTTSVLTAVQETKQRLDAAVSRKKEAEQEIRRIKEEIRTARRAFVNALRRTPSKAKAEKKPLPKKKLGITIDTP